MGLPRLFLFSQMKRPSFQWYPNDWLSASEVRACSLAARGLWIDMLCLMHQGTPYGHLTIGGKVYLNGSLEGTLARIVGTSAEEVKTLLEELEGLQVFSRTEEGVIYCRRMVADEQLRQVRAAGGFKALDHPNVPKPNLDLEGIPSTNTIEVDLQPIPSSSSSSSSSKEKKKASRASARSARRPSVCDQEYLDHLQADPAYERLNVRVLYHKMLVWCELKGKPPSRARFVAWLNREDQPMGQGVNGHASTPPPAAPEFCGLCERGWLFPEDGGSAKRCSCAGGDQ